jgi:hypothetical protein
MYLLFVKYVYLYVCSHFSSLDTCSLSCWLYTVLLKSYIPWLLHLWYFLNSWPVTLMRFFGLQWLLANSEKGPSPETPTRGRCSVPTWRLETKASQAGSGGSSHSYYRGAVGAGTGSSPTSCHVFYEDMMTLASLAESFQLKSYEVIWSHISQWY